MSAVTAAPAMRRDRRADLRPLIAGTCIRSIAFWRPACSADEVTPDRSRRSCTSTGMVRERRAPVNRSHGQSRLGDCMGDRPRWYTGYRRRRARLPTSRRRESFAPRAGQVPLTTGFRRAGLYQSTDPSPKRLQESYTAPRSESGYPAVAGSPRPSPPVAIFDPRSTAIRFRSTHSTADTAYRSHRTPIAALRRVAPESRHGRVTFAASPQPSAR